MKQILVRLQLARSRCADCLERGSRFWPLRKHLVQVGLGKRSQFPHHLTNLALRACALEKKNMRSADRKNLDQLLLSTKTHRPSATLVIPPLNALHQWVLVAYSPPINNVPCSANSSFCKATIEPWSDLSGKRTLGLFNAITQWLEPLTCCHMSVSALEVLGTSASTRATIVDPSSQSDDDLLGPGARDFATLGATFHWNIHKRPVSTVAFELGWPTKPRSSKKAALNKESETIWRFQKPSPLTYRSSSSKGAARFTGRSLLYETRLRPSAAGHKL